MKALRTTRLLLTFFRNYFFLSFLVTLSCSAILWINGLSSFVFIFWFKLITLGLIFYVISINKQKEKELFYYRNLGLSKTKLWAFTLTLDFSLYILLLIFTYQLKT
ncbi:MAG TPA: hypothetical protein PLL00_11400 [Bacteroidia bacterium]|nr:hypothetical protein [Bacteroidia bacterium]